LYLFDSYYPNVTIWLVTATRDVICVTCIVQTQRAFSNGYYIEATQNSELRIPHRTKNIYLYRLG